MKIKIPTAIDTQRLAIGQTGLGLRVTSGLSSGFLDKQEQVYHVAQHGIDDEAQGGSLNAPLEL